MNGSKEIFLGEIEGLPRFADAFGFPTNRRDRVCFPKGLPFLENEGSNSAQIFELTLHSNIPDCYPGG